MKYFLYLLLFAALVGLFFPDVSIAGPFGIFGNRYVAVQGCANGQCTVAVIAPARTLAALPVVVAAQPKAVSSAVAADLQTLDQDAQATAAVQTVVNADIAAVATAQAAVLAAQNQQSADTTSLTAAQKVQAAQLEQTIADLQAAYGATVQDKLKGLRQIRDAALRR
jgi:ribosomal protein L18